LALREHDAAWFGTPLGGRSSSLNSCQRWR